MQQVISVWVRDPRIRKNDFWHAYMDYEICLHVSILINSDPYNLLSSVCVTLYLSLVSDQQRVLHQEDLQCEAEVQRVRMAQAEAGGKFTANVRQITILWTHFFYVESFNTYSVIFMSDICASFRVKLPELPPKNPFFSLNNSRQITERMKGLQGFLEQ